MCDYNTKRYEVEISDGTGSYEDGPSLAITERNGDMSNRVMSIRKPCSVDEHYMLHSKDYVVNITWRKSGYHLISLVFKMMLPVNQYEALIAGDKKLVDEKIINFYLQTVKTLHNIEESFPV